MIEVGTLKDIEPALDWLPLSLTDSKLVQVFSDKHYYRFFNITEISEDKPAAYRLAMANVVATLRGQDCSLVYLLSSEYGKISIFLAVVAKSPKTDIHECGETIKSAFEGNFLGSKITPIKNEDKTISEILDAQGHLALITGIPSFNESDSSLTDVDFQGIERIANSLVNDKWQLMIVAEAINECEAYDAINAVYDLSTEISSAIKHSIQNSTNNSQSETSTKATTSSDTTGISESDTKGWDKGGSESKNHGQETKSYGNSGSHTKSTSDSNTTGTSDSESLALSYGSGESVTQERVNKKVEEIQAHVSETLLPRLRLGLSKGMFKTAIYAAAKKKAPFERLTSSILSIYQGNQSTMTPLKVHHLSCNSKCCLRDYLSLRSYQLDSVQKRNFQKNHAQLQGMILKDDAVLASTLLNTEEISLLAGLPSKELTGFKIRKSVDFGLNTPKPGSNILSLGVVVQNGRELQNNTVSLPINELNKHIFLPGVTGSGKTTSSMKILLESQLPFLVIEPAKTEYRALHQHCDDIEYYCIGNERLTPFRLNPFQLASKDSNLMGHISVLKATLIASFPMEAAMPAIVEEAIIKAYYDKGWDIYSNENYLYDEPFEAGSFAWPTFSDMINHLDSIIKSKGMGQEFEEKYQGSLVARLTNLTLGIKGRMLNTRYSMDFDALLNKKVVIELEELKDEQDKSFFMGLILSRLAECMKVRHKKDSGFRHLTLIEEAHRLLTRIEPSDPESKRLGVTMFTDMLSEVRKYGEGLIIADQSPTKLVADVIKNTNTKIVHRLLDASDRNAIGDAMSLNDEQKDFLQHLQPGETVIYCGGWHAPVRCQVDQLTNTTSDDIPEYLIQQRGYNQLWSQKETVLPNTSKLTNYISSSDDLRKWLPQGMSMLNLFLRINNSISEGVNKQQLAVMQKRYVEYYTAVINNLQLSEVHVSELLAVLFVDNALIAWDKEDYELAITPLQSLFVSLRSSLNDFTDCKRSSNRAMQSFVRDNKFSQLTSI